MKNKNSLNEERLGKLVAMAKRGEDGERDTAIRFVKSICQKHNLDFDEVMGGGEKIKTFHLQYRNITEAQLLRQVIFKYAYDGETKPLWTSRVRGNMLFDTTNERYIETSFAWDLLVSAYRKEKKRAEKAVFFGFLSKHDLYSEMTDEDRKKPQKLSEEELELRHTGERLAQGMKEVKIRKVLTDGKNEKV